MKYLYDYAVIGGDMRQVYLVEQLSLSPVRIGYCSLCDKPNLNHCSADAFLAPVDDPEQLFWLSSCIICPVPVFQHIAGRNLSSEFFLSHLKAGQSFFGGCIPPDFQSALKEKGVFVFDLMADSSLSCFNSIATAEGAICEAIRQSPVNLHKSHCAVLGYGKCGSTLSHYLKGMFCRLSVISDSEKELAQAALIADRIGTLKDFETYAGDFDYIFNTIPAVVITSDLLLKMKSTVVITDISSAPGGVDFSSAEKLRIHAFLCPGLPGKYAPASSAKAIKETIEKIRKENPTCL